MDKILENKLVVLAAVALFVVALGANSLMGGSMPAFASCLRFADNAVTVAHGPTLPPEPWLQKPAHGPTLPPEPWDGAPALDAHARTPAHGPTLPPEPWKL
jgi:hypothetical protein